MNAALTNGMGFGTLAGWISLALWLAGLAHFCVLGAGVQLPWRLNWREELSRLGRFNRKLFYVYYFFIGATVAAFGGLTFVLHEQMMAGETAALWLAGFMAFWWTARVVIDAFVFDHADWPQGLQFRLGHILLTTTFVAMALTYHAVWIAHFIRI